MKCSSCGQEILCLKCQMRGVAAAFTLRPKEEILVLQAAPGITLAHIESWLKDLSAIDGLQVIVLPPELSPIRSEETLQ